MSFLHTPYDGSSKPFTIGLTQLDVKDWIEVDENWPAYLAEKRRLYAEMPEKVIVSEAGSEAAQEEVLAILTAHLATNSPLNRHLGEGRGPASFGTAFLEEKLDPGLRRDDGLRDGAEELKGLLRNTAIARAALLVQEDLVLMRKSPEGWRLVAASLCFPSAWNLLEKFRKPLHEIHKPVPGFGAGTRNAGLIERMFDNLDPARLVLRWNWSLHGDAVLYHPHSNSGPDKRFGEGDLRGRVIIRLERQTLRKLPVSGDILFTIRIHLNPLEMLEARPDGAQLAASLAGQLEGLSADEANYKGITAERQRLAARLAEIASPPR